MTTTLACKSNEAVLNLGGTSCMEVLVPGEGKGPSLALVHCAKARENSKHTQSILGANGVIVREVWVMPNKAWRLQTSSPSTVRSLLFCSLQPSGWSLVEHQRRGSSPAALHPAHGAQTWVLCYLLTVHQCCCCIQIKILQNSQLELMNN